MCNTPTDKELEAFAIEEQFLLFCDVDEFTQIARAVLAKFGTPPVMAGEPVAWLSTDSIGERYLCFTKPNDSDPVRPLVFGDTTPQPAPAPVSDEVVRDAAFEAVRKKLCTLPRYSFVLDDDGLVRRAPDRTGNWIEFDEAHALFDPVSVDAALAAQGGKA